MTEILWKQEKRFSEASERIVTTLLLAASREQCLFLDLLSFLFCPPNYRKRDNDSKNLKKKRIELFFSLRQITSEQHANEDEIVKMLERHVKDLPAREKRLLLSHLSKHDLCLVQGDHVKVPSKHLLLYVEVLYQFVVDFSVLFHDSTSKGQASEERGLLFDMIKNEFLDQVLNIEIRSVNQCRKILAQMALLAQLIVRASRSNLIEPNEPEEGLNEDDSKERTSQKEFLRKNNEKKEFVLKQRVPSSITRNDAWEKWHDIENKWPKEYAKVISEVGFMGNAVTSNMPRMLKRDFFHSFFEKTNMLTSPTTCFCPKDAPKTRCFHISASRTEEFVCLFMKYIIIFNLLELLIKTASFIPRHFWQKIVKYGIRTARHDVNALPKAYQNSANSTHWLVIILPKTLVGDDKASVAALYSVLSREGTFLTSLIYKIPITDKRDDELIRAIDSAGGELHVPLTPTIDYPPLAISDNQKMFFTAVSEVRDIFPVIYAETRNVAFINEILGDFIDLFNRFPVYEEVQPHLAILYHWYHDARPPSLPQDTMRYLQKYGILDDRGRLTTLGDMIIKERLY